MPAMNRELFSIATEGALGALKNERMRLCWPERVDPDQTAPQAVSEPSHSGIRAAPRPERACVAAKAAVR